MIKPTIGRVVWYHPTAEEKQLYPFIDGQPFAALVCGVWSDVTVNLAFFDANGVAHNKTSVYLKQDDAVVPAGGYAEWMPYQKGQAAKTEQLEKALNA